MMSRMDFHKKDIDQKVSHMYEKLDQVSSRIGKVENRLTDMEVEIRDWDVILLSDSLKKEKSMLDHRFFLTPGI